MNRFTVVLDACVLYPAPLRDLLMWLAHAELFRARWTEQILDEWSRSLLAKRPDLSPERLERTRRLMNENALDALVTGYEPLIQGLVLPDPDDRHVLAAAIRVDADAIVTFNLDDFPASALAQFGIEALHPDEFLVHQVDLSPGTVERLLAQLFHTTTHPRSKDCSHNSFTPPPTPVPASLITINYTLNRQAPWTPRGGT